MADMGMGDFAEVSPSIAEILKKTPMSERLFRVGEEVKVKQSRFTVEIISEHELVLRLIPDDNHQQIPKANKV